MANRPFHLPPLPFPNNDSTDNDDAKLTLRCRRRRLSLCRFRCGDERTNERTTNEPTFHPQSLTHSHSLTHSLTHRHSLTPTSSIFRNYPFADTIQLRCCAHKGKWFLGIRGNWRNDTAARRRHRRRRSLTAISPLLVGVAAL